MRLSILSLFAIGAYFFSGNEAKAATFGAAHSSSQIDFTFAGNSSESAHIDAGSPDRGPHFHYLVVPGTVQVSTINFTKAEYRSAMPAIHSVRHYQIRSGLSPPGKSFLS